jgi:hypothetical protein
MATILVVGDVMLDVTWVVSDHAAPLAQHHGDVPPRRRTRPELPSQRLGAAACTSAALCALGYKVHCLGAWNPDDDNLLRQLAATCGDLALYNAAGSLPAVTITKFRVFVERGGMAPRLGYRFDQDPPAAWRESLNTKWEDRGGLPGALPTGVDAIVVMDFDKGLVTPGLIGALCERYCDTPWFVDSKSPTIVQTLRCVTDAHNLHGFFVNRAELVQLARTLDGSASSPNHIPVGRAQQMPMRDEELDHAVCGALQILATHMDGSCVIAKLDSDGAAAVQNTRFFRSRPEFESRSTLRNAAGVSAGDIFIAQWVTDWLARGARSLGEQRSAETAGCLARARAAAEGWVRFAESFWVGRDSELPRPETYVSAGWRAVVEGAHEGVELAAHEVKDRLDRVFDARYILEQPALDVGIAKHVLNDMLLTDLNVRANVRRFTGEVLSYLDLERPARPLNCLVVAAPGSGKSFFARQLALQLDLDIHEVNASQTATKTDFLSAIADLTVSPRRVPLLMIDEVDSRIDGDYLYGLLLSPMWDGVVRVGPRRHDLPRRMVMLLVTSTQLDQDERQSDGRATPAKLEDFLSRLNGPRFTLPSPRPADRVLIAAVNLLHYHPSLLSVERGFFEMVMQSSAGAREIELFVSRLHASSDGVLRSGALAAARLPPSMDPLNWGSRDLISVKDSSR